MNTLILYNKITDIKPNELLLPYIKPSAAKVQFNLKELDLHYYEEFGAYVSQEKIDEALSKKGGDDTRRIIVIEGAF
jgi:hypothetical protein